MSMESLIDKLGETPANQMTMAEAVLTLKSCPTFRSLVVSTSTMTDAQKAEVFHAIGVLKAGIVRNAFSNEPGEDITSFQQWPELADFIDTLMTGLSNA